MQHVPRGTAGIYSPNGVRPYKFCGLNRSLEGIVAICFSVGFSYFPVGRRFAKDLTNHAPFWDAARRLALPHHGEDALRAGAGGEAPTGPGHGGVCFWWVDSWFYFTPEPQLIRSTQEQDGQVLHAWDIIPKRPEGVTMLQGSAM